MDRRTFLLGSLGLTSLRPARVSPSEPKFLSVPPLRHITQERLPPTLLDIESRMPVNHQYRHQDLATWAHETTHGLNARLRNYRGDQNAFYCLDGRAVVLPEPRGVTIRQVAGLIPRELRGRLYQNYLINQQRWWNNQPLYLLDEWVAYYNDARVSKEIRERPHEGAIEFSAYALYVALAAGFQNVDLWKFVIWQHNRVKALFGLGL